MKVGAIIQARMSSRRLPNKVLLKVAGKPLLQYLLERLEHCPLLDDVVVATSDDDSDMPIADFCRTNQISCYRGSLYDVAARFVGALNAFQFDTFVRITGDSPLIDQNQIEKGVRMFLEGDYDLVTNAFPRSFPIGQTIEILDADCFRDTYPRMRDSELEHITSYYYNHQHEFKIKNHSWNENLSQLQLSVDTHRDLENFTKIVSIMSKPQWEYSLDEILQIFWRQNIPRTIDHE